MTKFSIDLGVLRLLRSRAKYERYKNAIPVGTLNNETTVIVRRLGEFFDETDSGLATFDTFWPFLRSKYPGWKEADAQHWRALIQPIDTPNPDGLEDAIIRNLIGESLGNRTLDLIEKWKLGAEFELGEALRAELDTYDTAISRKVRTPRVDVDMDSFLEEEASDAGLRWRLECLNWSTRGLRPGDFGIIAARPDRGKTSFVASEVAGWALQLHALYAGTRPIVWLNNEGPGRRIQNRVVQAAIGLTLREIIDLGADKIAELYATAIGHRDMIQVYDIHGFQTYEVAELLRKTNPALVVYDMIDNIRFAGQTINGGERTDQLLESMYQWAREQGVIHDFIGIATSQISDAGENMQYPLQNMLKDSRTGKQGACDFIVTLGALQDQPRTRYIGMTKNKIIRQGGAYSPQCAVYFDLDRSRFNMPTEVTE